MKRICLTGATGFVGRGVLPMLLGRGYPVTALVRSAAKLPKHSNLTVIEGDATSSDDLKKALAGCDTLVHLVGIRRKEMKKRGLTYDDVDVKSVFAAVNAMQEVGLKRIVLLSALHLGNSVYVQSKKKAEQLVIDSGLDWTILRPAFIIGKEQMWPKIFAPILAVVSLLPGSFGEAAKRSGNVSREQLAGSMVWAIESNEANNAVLEVERIRRFGDRYKEQYAM